MWHKSWQKCCLNFSDQFTLPLSEEVPTWQNAGGRLRVIWWAESRWDDSSRSCKGCKGRVSAPWSCVTGTPGHRRAGHWDRDQDPCFILWRSHLWFIALAGGTVRDERSITPHVSPLPVPSFNLMYSVYSWLLQCQEISCSILIEVFYVFCWEYGFTRNAALPKSFVTCWSVRKS